MTNVSVIYKETVQQLAHIYEHEEATSIANILFEDLLNVSRTQRLTNPDLQLNANQLGQLKQALDRLSNHEPIQQVVGFCYFYGLKFFVNHHVLTPRPETEELVDLIIRDNPGEELQVLDIGTGTGCIAIVLDKNLRNAHVTSWDISKRSLELARQNALENGSDIALINVDILHQKPKGHFDIIVSNPPYIPKSEQEMMQSNVLNFEPGEALFVPDEDPLLFYKEIANYGLSSLSPNGKLYFEIHELYGHQVKTLLTDMGYKQVALFQDMQNKDRIIRAGR